MWKIVTTHAPTAVPARPLPTTSAAPRATFAVLRIRNFRLFATGQVFSNTGSWAQRIAQDWLVLSITGSAAAVGRTTALQFLPTVLFGMLGGLLADRYPKRNILLGTQIGMSAMAAVLAALTLTHGVQEWHVDVIAFCLGTITAIDNPTRQAFVNEMVGTAQLRNAISINSSVFQLGGLIGPALSGLLIGAVGPGWAFAINAVSYAAPFTALRRMDPTQLNVLPSAPPAAGQLRAGLRYAMSRPDIVWPTVLAGVFGLFTANLPVTLTAFAKSVFHSGPSGYGLLSALVAGGSLLGAITSARRPRARLRTLFGTAGILASCYLLAAVAPGASTFAVVLVLIGGFTLLLFTSANSTVQLASHDTVRGRVMGIYLLVFVGSAALGGPLVGTIDQHLGPRTGMAIAGAIPALATMVIALRLARLAGRSGRGEAGAPGVAARLRGRAFAGVR